MPQYNSVYSPIGESADEVNARRHVPDDAATQYERYDDTNFNDSRDILNQSYRYDPHTSYGGASELSSLTADPKDPVAVVETSNAGDRLPLWRAVRRYPRIVAYCFAVTTAILGSGYASVLISSVNNIDQFLHHFGEVIDGDWQIPGMWQALWMSLDAAGGALGAVLGGWLQDRLGRRMSMTIGGVCSAIGVVTVFVADTPIDISGRRAMFLVGKITTGFATGIIKTTAMTYVSENTPTALRAPAMALFPTFTLLGQVVGTGVILAIRGIPAANNYRIAFSTEWVFSALAVGLGLLLPESPSHLVRKNQIAKAAQSAGRLYAPHASVEEELDRIVASVRKETETTVKPGYMECFRGVNARRTLIIIFTNVLPALFGLDLLSQASYFLLTIGMPSKTGLLFQLMGSGLAIVANAASVWILSRVGRRTATIPSLAAATAMWAAMGVSGFFTGTGAQYLTAVSMIGVILVCGIGAWPAGYAVMGETSALSQRAKSQAIGAIAGSITSVVFSFVLPLLFSRDGANLGSKTGLIYTGLSGIAVFTSWLYIPEMKGRSALEIDHMFAIGLPARWFKSWKGVVSVPA